jgi:two-component system, chemotaxis family, protein-glutamate methylesterase/glutaminase
MLKNKIKVLIVDDSAVVRQSLQRILNAHEGIEVIGVAADPFIAVAKIAEQVPDVITLDIEMPRMDGISFLHRLMAQHPIPVVIISSLTARGSELAMKALEAGAVDVIQKNSLSIDNFKEQETRIVDVVKAAGKAVIRRRRAAEQLHASPILKDTSLSQTSHKLIAVGASTGGTEAIKLFLQQMPVDCPGIVIVQHMPELFTKSFADRMNSLCKIQVKEAAHGDSVLRGRALIAPGNYHMEVRRSGARYFVTLNDEAPVNRHRPSVDVLFQSVANDVGKNATGVIMTGMGADGAKGMLAMHLAGSFTLAQDEKSCIVYGMPKEAVKAGGVSKIAPLDNLAAQALSSLAYSMF